MFEYVALIFHFFAIQYAHGQLCVNNQYNPNQQSDTSSCMIWNNYHLKTFDDHGISFTSTCKFTMTSFMIGSTPFRIEVAKSSFPCDTDDCFTYTEIYHGNTKYTLTRDQQRPVFSDGSKTYDIPSDLNGISLYRPGNRVAVDFTAIGISLRWDLKSNVEITIDNTKSYKVFGLCGNNDKCSSNDQILSNGEPSSNLEKFLQGWQADKNTCPDTIKTQSPCGSSTESAESACQILKNQQKFGVANTIVNPDPFIRACIWDYCSCKSTSPTPCLCSTLGAYAKTSVSEGVTRVNWRDGDTCPKNCTGDLHFQSCAPKGGPRTCGDSGPPTDVGKCEEGCYCFVNNFLFEGKCYLRKNCPCRSQGQILQAGQTTSSDCNTCTCTNGQLACEDKPCWCGSCTGDPHYTTFDGKKFDFMGRCAYYLVKGPNFSIESDQYGYYNGQFLKNYTEGPSYARGVFVRMAGQVIESKANLVTEVNNVLVTRFPHQAGPLLITKPSDQLILIYLPNNMQVEWDGNWIINVRIPRSMEGKVMGLLGTFTEDQSDDFLTPDGEIVDDPTEFGNSWKTEYSCRSEPLTPLQHPCEANPEAKAAAEKGCSAIKSEMFKKCNATDPETDYQNCVYDACYYKENITKSYCGSIESFSDECARKGIDVNWRESVPECKIPCPAGLEYQSCSRGCVRSCEDIALRPFCSDVCVAGCNCPAGNTLNEDGHCIPLGQCKCRIGEALFPAGFQYLRNEEELLTCTNARWVVTDPTEEDLKTVPYLEELNKDCASKKENSVYTACKNPMPKTCKNMHNYQVQSVDKCEKGCQCATGYVYDSQAERCVKPDACPCYSQGQSHSEGSVVKPDPCTRCTCRNGAFQCVKDPCEPCSTENETKQKDCNTCVCRKGFWDCTVHQCCSKEKEVKQIGCQVCTCVKGVWQCDDKDCHPSECYKEHEVKIYKHGKCVCKKGMWRCAKAQCDVWSHSNVKTFDGVHYEFQGECSYAITQGKLNDHQFNVILTNEQCTHSGATCLKSLTINTHVKNVPESLTLVKNEKLPNTNDKKSLLLTDYFSFVTVDFIGAGVQIFWDKKTWVYVQVNNGWHNKLVGLCGNFNGSQSDDLVVDGRPVSRKEAYRYANLWRTRATCRTGPKTHTCSDARVTWAKAKCNILRSNVFAPCHSRVPVANYYQACVEDTCNCERAGDCECLCTAISVYAQQCNKYGISIDWRKENLCPMQCLGYTHYQPCMKVCPPRTCETVEKNITIACEDETCVEGCAPECLRSGYVYTDSTYAKSVEEGACTAPVCVADGDNYYDQEIIEKTSCKLRYCSNGKEVCVKLPTCPKGDNSARNCSCS